MACPKKRYGWDAMAMHRCGKSPVMAPEKPLQRPPLSTATPCEPFISHGVHTASDSLGKVGTYFAVHVYSQIDLIKMYFLMYPQRTSFAGSPVGLNTLRALRATDLLIRCGQYCCTVVHIWANCDMNQRSLVCKLILNGFPRRAPL